MEFKEDIKSFFDYTLSEEQIRMFERYYAYLIEYNQSVNLTTIIERNEVFYKHFFDSLTAIKVYDFSNCSTICDMGSGAGFPSIPIKILFPNIHITIVDALNKRILFLNQLMKQLDLSGYTLIHDRIENHAIKHQSYYDLVLARALGNMSLISELGIPMTKIDGKFIAYKGSDCTQEINQAKKAIRVLGGEIERIESFDLPYNYGGRSLIVIQKKHKTSGYPRSFQLMKKKPL